MVVGGFCHHPQLLVKGSSRRGSRGVALPESVQYLNGRDEIQLQFHGLVTANDADVDDVAGTRLDQELLDLLKVLDRLTVERGQPIAHTDGLTVGGNGAGAIGDVEGSGRLVRELNAEVAVLRVFPANDRDWTGHVGVAGLSDGGENETRRESERGPRQDAENEEPGSSRH